MEEEHRRGRTKSRPTSTLSPRARNSTCRTPPHVSAHTPSPIVFPCPTPSPILARPQRPGIRRRCIHFCTPHVRRRRLLWKKGPRTLSLIRRWLRPRGRWTGDALQMELPSLCARCAWLGWWTSVPRLGIFDWLVRGTLLCPLIYVHECKANEYAQTSLTPAHLPQTHPPPTSPDEFQSILQRQRQCNSTWNQSLRGRGHW